MKDILCLTWKFSFGFFILQYGALRCKHINNMCIQITWGMTIAPYLKLVWSP